MRRYQVVWWWPEWKGVRLHLGFLEIRRWAS